jgi:hypothetical protein
MAVLSTLGIDGGASETLLTDLTEPMENWLTTSCLGITCLSGYLPREPTFRGRCDSDL